MIEADHLLEEVVTKIREQDIPAFPQESLAARFGAPSPSCQVTATARKKSRWRSWQLITAGSLAAALFLGAIVMLAVLGVGKAFAFDDVKAAVGTTQTLRYRILHFSDDPSYQRQYNIQPGEPAVSQVYCAGDRARSEQPLGIVTVVDPQKGLMMAIWHNQKRAVIEQLPKEEMLKKAADFRAMLRNIEASNARKLPDRELNGRTVSEFAFQMEGVDFTVSVNPQTKLPIRMEVVYPKNLETGQMQMREVFTDFVFDAPIDDALFRIEPPVDYHVENHVPQNITPQPPEKMELVVSPEEGIGPVKFGTKAEEIVKLLGEPDWRSDDQTNITASPGAKPDPKVKPIKWTELNYSRRGFRLMADESKGLYLIDCDGNRNGTSTEAAFRGRTKEGISLGASWDDVQKTYGEPNAQMEFSRLWYQKIGYRFEFRGKKLVSIRVMRPMPNIEVDVKGDRWIERVVRPKKDAKP